MKFIQLNLNHCAAAQDLLEQSIRELEIDVTMVSEQFRNHESSQRLISDSSNRTAIWVCGSSQVQVRPNTQGELIAWAQVDGIHAFNLYAPPSLTDAQPAILVDTLVDEAMRKRPLVMAGVFNAWSTDWGSWLTSARGNMLLDRMARLDVCLVNTGSEPTFVRGYLSSVIDLTFASDDLLPRMLYEIAETIIGCGTKKFNTRKWKARSLDRETFILFMAEERQNQWLSRSSGKFDYGSGL